MKQNRRHGSHPQVRHESPIARTLTSTQTQGKLTRYGLPNKDKDFLGIYNDIYIGVCDEIFLN